MISCLARCRCGSTQALALSRFFKTDAISPARKSLKTTNEPGKVPPYVLKSKSDWIGPPDKESHIRPTHFYQTPSESPARTAYRLAVEDAAKWNHDFWAKRNRDFFANREEFVRNSMKKARTDSAMGIAPSAGTALSTEQMSVFYKRFLTKHKKEHLDYMKGWYRRNFRVLKTAIKLTFANVASVKKMKS